MQLRCVCLNLKFTDLMKIARKRGITDVDELSLVTECGTKCGTCMPLLDELMRSGKLRLGDQLIDFPLPDDEPRAQ
jgi:NAD(P)H-nitrite reductase large subunit